MLFYVIYICGWFIEGVHPWDHAISDRVVLILFIIDWTGSRTFPGAMFVVSVFRNSEVNLQISLFCT